MSSSFPSSLWDSCWLLESVCACPCVLCLSLPVSHLSPCTGVPLFGLPFPLPQSLSFISHLPVPSLSLSPILSITSFNSPSLFLSNFSCFCHLSVLSYVSACFPLLFSFSEFLHLSFCSFSSDTFFYFCILFLGSLLRGVPPSVPPSLPPFFSPSLFLFSHSHSFFLFLSWTVFVDQTGSDSHIPQIPLLLSPECWD